MRWRSHVDERRKTGGDNSHLLACNRRRRRRRRRRRLCGRRLRAAAKKRDANVRKFLVGRGVAAAFCVETIETRRSLAVECAAKSRFVWPPLHEREHFGFQTRRSRRNCACSPAPAIRLQAAFFAQERLRAAMITRGRKRSRICSSYAQLCKKPSNERSPPPPPSAVRICSRAAGRRDEDEEAAAVRTRFERARWPPPRSSAFVRLVDAAVKCGAAAASSIQAKSRPSSSSPAVSRPAGRQAEQKRFRCDS